MKLNFITQEAWREFGESFPQATAFLLHKSLEGELRVLQNKHIKTTKAYWKWDRGIARRIEDLEQQIKNLKRKRECMFKAFKPVFETVKERLRADHIEP